MSDLMERSAEENEKLVVDGEFLRAQANEAVETFFAPLVGVVAAARGRRIFLGRRKRPRRHAI